MKIHTAISTALEALNIRWQPAQIAEPIRESCYSYPITNNRHTGKAAERRAAKQRRRARL